MTSHIPQHDEHKEMSDWFISLFPKIRPAFIADDGCWIASMMTRSSDHNPPWAWIGWAFDSVSERGGFSQLQERMIEMHGEKSCRGHEVLDEAVRQLVTETCATAWSLKRFGSNNLPLSNGAHIENNQLDWINARGMILQIELLFETLQHVTTQLWGIPTREHKPWYCC